jgi:tetratricopeptide (TPR) repeat protein
VKCYPQCKEDKMQQSYARLTLAIALSLPLGACSSIFGSNTAARSTQQMQPAETVTPALASGSTEDGRAHLGAGRVGLAIEAFQRALASGEPVAPALNGMGVAYARLGRSDAAKRFFEQASAMEPTNEKFAANLVNLMRSPAFAARQNRELMAQLANGTGNLSPMLAPAQANAAPRLGQLQRVSRSEVRIAAAPSLAAPLLSARSQPSPAISLPTRKTLVERGQAPVSDRKQAAAGQSISPAYPLRIEFSGASRNMLMREGEVASAAALPKQARRAATPRSRASAVGPDFLSESYTYKPQYPIRLVL